MAMRAISTNRRCLGVSLVLLLTCLLPVTTALAANKVDPKEQPEQAAAPETFATLMSRAEAGDAKAQCEVGVAYLNGQNVAQDFRMGLHWLTRSSDAGFGYARYVLADVYNRGYAGVPIDDEKAYYYATLAAASSTLADNIRERAVKLRDRSAKQLSAAQLSGIQARTALAPLDFVGDSKP